MTELDSYDLLYLKLKKCPKEELPKISRNFCGRQSKVDFVKSVVDCGWNLVEYFQHYSPMSQCIADDLYNIELTLVERKYLGRPREQ